MMKEGRQRQPITSMAIMEALCQPEWAVAASVSGIRTREIAAERRRRPNMSRECRGAEGAVGEGGGWEEVQFGGFAHV